MQLSERWHWQASLEYHWKQYGEKLHKLFSGDNHQGKLYIMMKEVPVVNPLMIDMITLNKQMMTAGSYKHKVNINLVWRRGQDLKVVVLSPQRYFNFYTSLMFASYHIEVSKMRERGRRYKSKE